MSESSASPELARARRVLASGRKLLSQVWSALKARTSKDGRISSSKLDQHQLLCFDAAVCTAEVSGAGFMLDYGQSARKSPSEQPLEEAFALVSVAEAIQNLRHRLASRLNEVGLDRSILSETIDVPEVVEFCDATLSSDNLAAIGREVSEREGYTGASMLEEKHELMRDTFRQFASDVVAPLAEEVHGKDLLIPDAILSQVKELGCFGISIPERYDGLQPDDEEDTLSMCVVTEELSRGSLGAAGSLITRPEILARALMAGGTEEQKSYWLPKLAAGEPLCAVGVTEPDYGSDVAAMKFKAEPTEGGWLLNGTKTWLTFGGMAGVLLVLARTDPDPKKGHKGLSVFLVEKPSFPGHDFEHTQQSGGTISGRAIATIGYRGMHSYETFFDNYFVPDSALLGGEGGKGKGFYYIMAGFSGGRIQTAARAVGVMQAAFDKAVTYAAERKVFAKPIAEYQLTQVKLARMATALCTVRRFTYGVAGLMDKGEGAVEASMVKLYAGRVAEWLTREAMQIHGGMGYAEETDVSRYFVDARVLSIFEGAEETLALKVVARGLVERAI
jgi:(2S)-methylsuccinyl-CoA dehydrogenase